MIIIKLVAAVTVLSIILAVYLYFKDKRDQALSDGPITKEWNRISTFVFSSGIANLVIFFGVPEAEFNKVFGDIGESIRLIEAAIALLTSIYVVVRSWITDKLNIN